MKIIWPRRDALEIHHPVRSDLARQIVQRNRSGPSALGMLPTTPINSFTAEGCERLQNRRAIPAPLHRIVHAPISGVWCEIEMTIGA